MKGSISAQQDFLHNLVKNSEKQLFNSVLDSVITGYKINISNDTLDSDILVPDEKGNLVSAIKCIGLSLPCRFSKFYSTWKQKKVPEEYWDEYTFFDEIISILKNKWKEGKHEIIFTYWMINHLGEKMYTIQRIMMYENDFGEICATCLFNDFTDLRISEEKKRQEELRKIAYLEPVTGGINYYRFKEIMQDIKSEGFIVSVDIHGFKVINSTCGPHKGDECIKKLWENILEQLDQKDHAGHINADHFIIFFATKKSEEVERKLKNLSMLFAFSSTILNVPQMIPYFGLTEWKKGKTVEIAYSEAVAAAKKIKNDTSVNFVYFTEEDTKRLVEEKKMIDSFEDSVARKDFKILYQPKFSPVNKKIIGAEALVRWKKEDGTYVLPGEFIPLFEKNGMIQLLDEYVFRNVCVQQKKWLNAGKAIVPVSVNLSRASLYYKDVVKKYKRIVDAAKIPQEFVPIEITESAAINDTNIKKITEEFYNAGFHLHLDDFGSGYSSLSSLNALHFDTLKIDKSLVDYIGNYKGDRLLEHTISLAREFGMHVTAEGVEQPEQNIYLKHIGCDSIQGFFFSKPVSAEMLEEMIENASNTVEHSEEYYVSEYIDKFRMSLTKISTYDFVVDLEDNHAYEEIGSSGWFEETHAMGRTYDENIDYLVSHLVVPEYRESFARFMDRHHLLVTYCGNNETRILYYKRWLKGRISDMRLTVHLFSVKDSEKIWMYVSITEL